MNRMIIAMLMLASVDRLEGPGWVAYQARILAMSGDAANAVPPFAPAAEDAGLHAQRK